MNLYATIDELLKVAEWPEKHDALANALLDVTEAYEGLKPTPDLWAKYPWAQWVTLSDNGRLIWWELEPEARIMPNGEYAWKEKDGHMGRTRAEQVNPLPPHIDWRDCKWERPEANA